MTSQAPWRPRLLPIGILFAKKVPRHFPPHSFDVMQADYNSSHPANWLAYSTRVVAGEEVAVAVIVFPPPPNSQLQSRLIDEETVRTDSLSVG